MLQEFAGEGIPLLASSVPADTFLPYLNELLPLIMNKAVSSNPLKPSRVVMMATVTIVPLLEHMYTRTWHSCHMLCSRQALISIK